LNDGHGLVPGNAVRLCRHCNSFVHARGPEQLSPRQARKLETAAAQFKEFWEGGCAGPVPLPAAPEEEPPEAPDPALVALLRAVERGDDGAVAALVDWLEGRGDPRAVAIRAVTKLEVVVREVQTAANKVSRWAEYFLDGNRNRFPADEPWPPGNTEESLAQHARELRSRCQLWEVWPRLGLSGSQRAVLVLYLGIMPPYVALGVTEIAQRMERRVQTIWNRIDLALHRLAVPTPCGHRPAVGESR
jgi:hypothetical protein